MGFTLDELRNEITGGKHRRRSNHRSITSSPRFLRFAFEKFPAADNRLTTQMKSVGEVMAIGRTFPRILPKSPLRGLEVGADKGMKTTDREVLEKN